MQSCGDEFVAFCRISQRTQVLSIAKECNKYNLQLAMAYNPSSLPYLLYNVLFYCCRKEAETRVRQRPSLYRAREVFSGDK